MRRISMRVLAAGMPTLCGVGLMAAELAARLYAAPSPRGMPPGGWLTARLLADLLLLSPLYALRARYFYAAGEDARPKRFWWRSVCWRLGLWRRLVLWTVPLLLPGTLFLGLARHLRGTEDTLGFTAATLLGVGLLLLGAVVLWTRYLRLLPAVYLLGESGAREAFRRSRRLTRRRLNDLMAPIWWWGALFPLRKALWIRERAQAGGEAQVRLKTLAREGRKAHVQTG